MGHALSRMARTAPSETTNARFRGRCRTVHTSRDRPTLRRIDARSARPPATRPRLPSGRWMRLSRFPHARRKLVLGRCHRYPLGRRGLSVCGPQQPAPARRRAYRRKARQSLTGGADGVARLIEAPRPRRIPDAYRAAKGASSGRKQSRRSVRWGSSLEKQEEEARGDRSDLAGHSGSPRMPAQSPTRLCLRVGDVQLSGRSRFDRHRDRGEAS